MTSSRATFFRQSGWMILATTLSGMFMFAVNLVANRMDPGEFTVFRTLVTVYLLMSFPSTGLQVVFTHQTAAIGSNEDQRRLAATIRAVLRAAFFMWLGIAALVFAFQKQIGETLKITNPTALWITVVLGLSSLCLPILRGVLQGAQNFFGLGWIAILDGAARFVAVVLIIRLGGQAAGAMTGALAGQIIALSTAFWLTRSMLRGASAPRPWSAWLKNAIPLSLASSSVLLMTGADVIFVQSTFPKTQTQYYIGAQIIGVALVMLTSPVAAVMFPKIVESATHAQRTDALQLALGGTALITGAAALACTLMPELPLRILYFRKPEYWRAAVLIPWFAWALLPLILANLLVNNLMARGRFAVAPWLAVVAAAYIATLLAMRSRLGQMEMFNAFKTIIGTLGLFSTLLLIAALLFTRRETIAVEPGKSAIISDATPHDD